MRRTWGLAKDLTAIERTAVVGGPSLTTPNDDLTAAGTVLGTPAYMAPEQKHGVHVDQRADVYAIGAMLWELCVLEKAPTEPQLRHRMLRRAGIDKDLATIVDKALDLDPARRYPHAGALAADLKAFKSGARIAARSYSLPALLTHSGQHANPESGWNAAWDASLVADKATLAAPLKLRSLLFTVPHRAEGLWRQPCARAYRSRARGPSGGSGARSTSLGTPMLAST